VTQRDLWRWAAEFRDDILERVSPEDGLIHPADKAGGSPPLHPIEAMEGSRCPFLKRLPPDVVYPRERMRQDVYTCTIHDTKPDACVRFPSSRGQAARIGCLGIVSID
jgi:Fe-S-cluster containining protein